ncbi:hypothetical protein DB30_04462 [Enhygromyxa salina]|uniref:Knr4/Smi1-like domain-containing protein n=1 Tax=Enhygromyxa salina TaxID=215803 RepID=A0A0C1ZYT8_9BACT|nr:hypothetical protein [Enhygromyxa salina]KIG16418.1 hypothetical protein DB30_04462 [Enhygromyxa salina]
MTDPAAVAKIDELVQLVSAWQPDFGDRVAGAKPQIIDAIEAGLGAGLGAVLEPVHRAFLERMGADSDGLNAYGDDVIDLRAQALLEFIEAGFNPDPRAFVIAGVPSEEIVPLLMFDRRGQPEQVPLVRLGFGDGERPAITLEHSSFAAMLFGFAFLTKCLPRHAWELHLESPGTQPPRFPGSQSGRQSGRWLPRFTWILGQLGFATIANTGPWCVCGERAGAAVMMYECPGFTPDVRVAADQRVELMQLVELLSDNLELRTRPTSLRKPG